MSPNYLDTVNKILEGLFKQGLLYKTAQAANAVQNNDRPAMQNIALDMAMMGSTNTPSESITTINPARNTVLSVLDRIKAKGTPDQVRTIRPSPEYLKQQMEDIINRVRTY